MFKIGSKYSRKDVGEIYFPGEGRPKGGAWDTGYVRVQNDLIIFMNIDIPGTTGHDLDNKYDEENGTITWFGKPKSHSSQPTFKKLLSREYTPHFFARWDNKPTFKYLGIGNIIKYEDGYETKDGKGNPSTTIKVVLTIRDVEDILGITTQNEDNHIPFALEKQLEDFIVSNWDITEFGDKYDIYEENGRNGKQYPTGVGPCDILAISKDKSEFLIIELKKGRASDKVVGQLTRYMGAIRDKLAKNGETVKGCIIAYENDINLRHSLSVVPNTDFFKYKIQFNLEKID